jgi:hypothetical protein
MHTNRSTYWLGGCTDYTLHLQCPHSTDRTHSRTQVGTDDLSRETACCAAVQSHVCRRTPTCTQTAALTGLQ